MPPQDDILDPLGDPGEPKPSRATPEAPRASRGALAGFPGIRYRPDPQYECLTSEQSLPTTTEAALESIRYVVENVAARSTPIAEKGRAAVRAQMVRSQAELASLAIYSPPDAQTCSALARKCQGVIESSQNRQIS